MRSHRDYTRSSNYKRSRGAVRPAIEWFDDYSIPEPNSGCLLWIGPFGNSLGKYGSLSIGGKRQLAHRWAFENFVGPIPDGMNVCHRCDNNLCVNPDHLFLGTQSENIQDCYRKGRGNRAPRVQGNEHHLAVLNETLVREILENKDGLSNAELADKYGVGRGTIWYVLNGRTWKHVVVSA